MGQLASLFRKRSAQPRRDFSVILLLTMAIASCGRGPAIATVTYEGQTRSPEARCSSLPRFSAVPHDFEILGTSRIECQRERILPSRFTRSLGQLLCSPTFLTRMLEEQACRSGGVAFHRFSCNAPEGQGDGVDAATTTETFFECSANVLANNHEPRVDPVELPSLSVTELAGATVTYDGTTLPSRRFSGAEEVPYRPVTDARLGTLHVYVSKSVSREQVRNVIRLSATELGAERFVLHDCVIESAKPQWSCVAELTVGKGVAYQHE